MRWGPGKSRRITDGRPNATCWRHAAKPLPALPPRWPADRGARRSRTPAETARSPIAFNSAGTSQRMVWGLALVSGGHAARADLLRRLGRGVEAIAASRRAHALTQNETERRFLARRIGELSAGGWRPSTNRTPFAEPHRARQRSRSAMFIPAAGRAAPARSEPIPGAPVPPARRGCPDRRSPS